MKSDFIAIELENIDRYFNGESLIDSPYPETIKKVLNDQWTMLLKAYAIGQQDVMGKCIGELSLIDWRDEEKLLWNILLATRCAGSEEYINKLILELNKFTHNNHQVEALLMDVGRILLNREIKTREEKYQEEIVKLQKTVEDTEKKTDEARADLQRHEMSGSRG